MMKFVKRTHVVGGNRWFTMQQVSIKLTLNSWIWHVRFRRADESSTINRDFPTRPLTLVTQAPPLESSGKRQRQKRHEVVNFGKGGSWNIGYISCTVVHDLKFHFSFFQISFPNDQPVTTWDQFHFPSQTHLAISGFWYKDIEQSAAVNPSAHMQVPPEQFPLKVQSFGQTLSINSFNNFHPSLVSFLAVVVFRMASSSHSFAIIVADAIAKSKSPVYCKQQQQNLSRE